MDLILNYGFAWLSVLFGLILAIKYIVRKLARLHDNARQLNKQLRKTHILFGILLVLTGLVHGLNSSDSLFSLNLGTITWVLSILLGINYAVRSLLIKGAWIKIHRVLTVLFLCIIVIHVIDVGGIQILNEIQSQIESNDIVYEAHSDKATESANNEVADADINNKGQSLDDFNSGMQGVQLKDGNYTGVADGYGKNLTVSVTIRDNRITDIVITKHNEKQSRFYARPIAEIPEAIIDSQSLDVDTISGATYTSVVIINAVNDALSQALVSGDLPAMKELPKGHGRK